MELNSFLFPAPQSSYTIHGSLGEIIYIPRNFERVDKQNESDQINEERENLEQSREEMIFSNNKKTFGQPSQSFSFGQTQGLSKIIEEQKTWRTGDQSESDKLRDNQKVNNGSTHNLFHSRQNSQDQATMQKEMKKQQLIESPVKKKKKADIPCYYMPYTQGSSKLLIYFHGNAEDIGLSTELLDYVHVLAVEYPGYGIYDGSPDAHQVQKDAQIVYDYLTQVQGIKENQIILFGRSIGTAPSAFVASRNSPCALLLMSPFTSIRDIVKEAASVGRYLQYMISERFRTVDLIENVKCPTFIVHGQRDTLISYTHAQQLHFKCGGPSALIMPKDMDHNEFDFIDDLIQPFYLFLKQCNITTDVEFGSKGQIDFPESLYIPPEDFPKENKNSNMWNWILRKFINVKLGIMNLIKEIIDRRSPISIKKVKKKELVKTDLKQFISQIRDNQKLKFDENRQEFYLIFRSQFTNKEELLKFMLATKNGIQEEEEDFSQALDYYQLRPALEDLKEEGYIRLVSEKKRNKVTVVLFPCNLDEKDIELRQEYPAKSIAFLSDLWTNEIPKIDSLKYDEFLLDNNLLTENEKDQLRTKQYNKAILQDEYKLAEQQKKRKARAGTQKNEHMPQDFLLQL